MERMHQGHKSTTTPSARAASSLIKILIYIGAAVSLAAVGLCVSFFRWTGSHHLRAFRIPSDSMCPAICLNERIIVVMDSFTKKPTARGEVILFNHGTRGPKFLKRVIAVGGDTVSMGPGNLLLVNGKAVELPGACGDPVRSGAPSSEPVQFKTLTVPQDSFFVVGDNLSHSLDSRFQGFGLVKQEQVQGQALFIYWSPGKSRIGCPIR